MIHVCFGLYDATGKYSKFTGTTICSLFENHVTARLPSVTVHILHDATLTAENREKFSYLAGSYGQLVKFHNVEEICAAEVNFLRENLAEKIQQRFSIGTFYRLLLKKILGTGKIIYLDSDIIVNLDIAELWRQDMENFPVASVPEIHATHGHMIVEKFLLETGHVRVEDYFCAGVMIFNLNALDDNFFSDGVQFLINNPQCASLDQDILNAFFAANYLKLDQKFDSFVYAERMKNALAAQKIYHYAGNALEMRLDDPFNRLWLEYFMRTPWFDADSIGRLYEDYRQTIITLKRAMVNTSAVVSGKTRVLFAYERDFDALRTIFGIRPDEQILSADEPDAVEKLIAALEESRGKKVFFIMPQNFPFQVLANAGFEPNIDFVNGLEFLSEANGIPLNSHELVKVM